MDQNNQQDNIFMSAPTVKNAKYYRTVARQKLKLCWPIAILVAFLATLLGGIGNGLNLNIKMPSSGLDAMEMVQIGQWIQSGDIDLAIAEIIAQTPSLSIFLAIIGGFLIFAALLAILFVLFVASPVKVGYQRFHLEINDGHESEIRVGTLFRFFKESYFKTIGLNVLHTLLMLAAWIPTAIMGVVGIAFIVTQIPLVTSLWEVFFAIGIGLGFVGIGGIVTAVIQIPLTYMYGMAHLIMADHPGISPMDALRSSRTLMKGNKWRLFCLDFSFFGWYFLGMLCFGIGVIVVYPYHQAARVAFYHDIAGRDAANDTEFPSLDPDDYQID